MRYALYYEFDLREAKDVFAISKKIREDKAINPDNYPKDIFPPQGHIFGKPAGFYLVEGTSEQVFHFTKAWNGLKTFRVEAIRDTKGMPEMTTKALDL
jgi:hypothetical protein